MCQKPWKNTLPPMVEPLLILHSLCIHMMGPIVETIQHLDIKVQYIPGGCSYSCQPDIGQVSTSKSSIHFKYFYLLTISTKYFLFVKRRSPREISKQTYPKICGFSETYIQKDMLFITSGHAARHSIILSSRNKLIFFLISIHEFYLQNPYSPATVLSYALRSSGESNS